MALVYVALDEKDQVFQWLERGYRERSSLLPVVTNPLRRPLRNHPSYEELLRRMNLPEDAIARHLAQ